MSEFILSILTVTILASLSFGKQFSYEKYKVFAVTPSHKNHLNTIKKFNSDSANLKLFDEIQGVNKSVNILVSPTKVGEFTRTLKLQKIRHKLVHTNFQTILNRERVRMQRRCDPGYYNWQSYQTLGVTYKWLNSLESEFPNKVKVITGGSTYENRKILGVKISFKSGNKGVFIEGGIHAREWISPATVTFLIDQILRSKDRTVRETVEQFDWYIFPHCNPDGYVYTLTTDRLWRKTRSPQGSCFGVDPNRNWDFHWGSSEPPCSESYPGKSAFSEIETRSFSKFITSLNGKIHTYISFHSFSQLLMFPYGYTAEHVSNYNDLMQIGKAAAKALSKRFGTKYKVGDIYETVYPATGNSLDWVYGIAGVKLSFVYELRPTVGNEGGFIFSPNKIIPVGQETLDSVIALLKEARKLNYYN